ncbi:hypothetical protein ACH42_06530 [Endozoicomonas sp. (ex Bugula neritina AB1)]|nr:hypothetical protein ACH42_06530 [Endozoicomonas sp. (ex Bugula neritina AB1)]
MKRQFAIVSLLSTVLFLSACSSIGSHTQPNTTTPDSWQKCAAMGGAVWGIPAAMSSLATGGVAAVAGALAAGISCATADQSTDVLFDFGTYDLDMKDRLIIDKMVDSMSPEGRIKVVGYTCDIGTDEVNQVLSERRAQAVKEHLMNLGVEEHKIITEGMGEKNPVATNDSEENRKLNRRVEVIMQ